MRRLLARAALAPFEEIVAVSQQVKQALTDHAKVSANRVGVCAAFISSEVVAGLAPASFEEVRHPFQPLLAYAHHPSPVYGRGLLLDALRRFLPEHPRAGLVCFGPGVDSPEFREDVRSRGLEEQVQALGELSHDRALAVIKAADVFVRPTSADGDALSVREALALGTRCVASDVAERPAGVRTFKSGDCEDLVKSLSESLAAPVPKAGRPLDAGEWLLPKYERLAVRGGAAGWLGSAPGSDWRGRVGKARGGL